MRGKGVVRRWGGRPARALAGVLLAPYTGRWPAYSRLIAVGEGRGWSVDEDAAHVRACAGRLGYRTAAAGWARVARRQAVFFSSHFSALHARWLGSDHRLGLAYYHGRPGTPGHPEFDRAYEALRLHARRVQRVQVTHAEMRDLVLSAGVPAERVFTIPLGVDLETFPLGDGAARAEARRALRLPQTAFVVGSFQKDGVGWGEGLQPKLVKGPDVLVATLERLRAQAPELVVLLTGPARGYVKRELAARGIPYRHVYARSRGELARAYRALDVYLVCSRQEGGPKAVLEAMASGVPLVATRVGQAQELVEHGRNGLLCEVEEVEALASACASVREDPQLAARLRREGRQTAERYALDRLDPLWAALLEGFVEKDGHGG